MTDAMVTITIRGKKIRISLAEAAELRYALDEALEWAPGVSAMIFDLPNPTLMLD